MFPYELIDTLSCIYVRHFLKRLSSLNNEENHIVYIFPYKRPYQRKAIHYNLNKKSTVLFQNKKIDLILFNYLYCIFNDMYSIIH